MIPEKWPITDVPRIYLKEKNLQILTYIKLYGMTENNKLFFILIKIMFIINAILQLTFSILFVCILTFKKIHI